MSVLSGPPLWGSSGLSSNLFPLPPRIGNVYIDDQPLDVLVRNGMFSLPVTLRRGAHTELSFDIPEANLGRPYYVGKPGFWRNLPPSASIFLGASVVYLFCDPVARVRAASFSARAPTGHVVVGVSPTGMGVDFSRGSTRIRIALSSFMDGPTLILWGLTFEPSPFAAIPV